MRLEARVPSLCPRPRPSPPSQASIATTASFCASRPGLGVLSYRTWKEIYVGDGYSLTPPAQTQLGLDFSGSLGRAVKENLLVHFDYAFSFLPKSRAAAVADYHFRSRYLANHFGAGLTYYLTPSNFYLSGSLGILLAQVKSSDGGYYFKELYIGPGIRLSVGKEWWVSENWGLGVALLGQYAYGKNVGNKWPDDSWERPHEPDHIQQGGASLLFSVTYN